MTYSSLVYLAARAQKVRGVLTRLLAIATAGFIYKFVNGKYF